MMKITLAAAALITVVVPAAHAQTAGLFMTNPAFQVRPARCVSTLEMQQCAADDLRKADALMSARYAALRDRLPPAARQKLLSEQRTWLRSRDRDCLAKGRGGGSIASLNVARCWTIMTRERATALDRRTGQVKGKSPTLSASAFLGRWRGGEGTVMKITRQGDGFVIDNQWGLDSDMHGVFAATLTPSGLQFRRNGVTLTARPSVGDAINLSALRGRRDCLKISQDEGYCRY